MITALVALTGSSSALPAHAAGYQVPAAIPGDCSADVTQPILAWIASVPDNSDLSFGNGACYRIDGTLELTNRTLLRVEGNGATFMATTRGARARAHWRLVGGSGLVFRNMRIRGASSVGGSYVAALQHQHAFDLKGVAGVELDRIDASDLYGDCVYVGQGLNSSRSWSSAVYVHDSTCTRNGRMGVAVVAGRNVLVETTVLSNIALTAFDIEPNGPGFGARNITFRNNLANGRLPGNFFSAIGDGPVDGVMISGNRIVGESMYMAVFAPRGQRRSNVVITGNSTDTGRNVPGSSALDFERVDSLTVSQNTVPLSGPNMALASVSESCYVNISGNSFPGGVTEARIHPFSCAGQPPSRLDTWTTLQVRRNHQMRKRSMRLLGRVRQSQSGRVVLHLERFGRTKREWATVRTRNLRLGRHSRFATRLRGLKRGRWRARAVFGGTSSRAPSRSRYRYFRVR